ncbi:TonB-dependent receptor domain-containing protein [Mucilaginibacter sp. AW1-3]
MIFLRPKLTVTLLFTLFIFAAKAQQTAASKPTSPADGHISGKVIDGTNAEPVAFATVALIKKADNQIAKAIQTDIQGGFKLDNVAYGRYLLRITFVGYATVIKDSIAVNANHKTVNFGVLKMHAGKAALLNEVSVRSKKSSIQLGIDRKVFTVDQSLVSEGGSATDLLANVPSVQVDVDGNVNLRGSSNVRILIDGKPSLIAGGTVTDILQSIPASAIETIELITNPSSKYDPEGQSGIINIVLKKNKSLGFTGSASASLGTLNAFNSNISLAYQHKKINIYGNYSHRQNNRSAAGYSYRTRDIVPADLTTPFQYNQNQLNTGGNNGNQIKAGIDYNLTNKTTVSFSSNINIRDNRRIQNSTTNGLNIAQALVEQYTTDNHSNNHGNNHDFNVDFSQKFKKPKEELTANFGLAKGNENNVDNLNTNYYLVSTPPSKQFNTNLGNERNWNLQVDYTDPIGKNGKLELGYRTTLSRADNNFVADTIDFATNQFVLDPSISTRFIYDEKVHAVYGNYQQQFGKFGLQAGARFEKTIINTNLVNFDTSHVQNYFRVYPSIFLSEKLSETQTLQLSYTRRINRPRDREIIPFLDKSDPLAYRIGNADLKPEDVHSFELSYAKYWKSTTLTSSVYYRRTNDIVQFIRVPYDTTGITITKFANFSYGTTAGFEFIARTDITNKWNITANLNLYQNTVKGSSALGIPDNNGFAWNGNLTTNLTLPYSLSLQLRGDYQAPQAIAQGRSKANSGLDAALKYDFYKHKASLSLNGRDLFDTRKFGFTTDDGVYHNNVDRRFQSRMFLMTLSYRFGRGGDSPGKGKDKKDKQPDGNNPPDDGGGGGPQ